ncbi:MAG: plasmid pRiA4b ORF-3 family protein [Myxococcota bacterium]|jgi:hypothetical protein|nr:plasmid pRiA4b ORF-3 family protein [Myxococcota bacterium]
MPKYYEFEVSLQEIQPRIWRRFLLRNTATFAQLHQAIQLSFGWDDRHLWEFRLPTHQGRPIAGLLGGEEYDRPTPDAKAIKLAAYFTGKLVVEWCEYIYDFGDDWIHDVKLIAVRSEKESFRRRLLDGERAAPPEDCGGTPGYENMVHFVETGEDIHSDDPEGLRVWLGVWQPDAFDLAKAKAKFDR